jgi:hypothetical protein
MAKILVLRNAAGLKIAELPVTEKPEERDTVNVAGVDYKIFRLVSPNLKRGADIVFRAVVSPV